MMKKQALRTILYVAVLASCTESTKSTDLRDDEQTAAEEGAVGGDVRQPDAIQQPETVQQPGSAPTYKGELPVSEIGSDKLEPERRISVGEIMELNEGIVLTDPDTDLDYVQPIVVGLNRSEEDVQNCRTGDVEFLTLSEYAAWEPPANVKLAVVICSRTATRVLDILPATSKVDSELGMLFVSQDADYGLKVALDLASNPDQTEIELQVETASDGSLLSVAIDEKGQWGTADEGTFIAASSLIDADAGEDKARLLNANAGEEIARIRLRARNIAGVETKWSEFVSVFQSGSGEPPEEAEPVVIGAPPKNAEDEKDDGGSQGNEEGVGESDPPSVVVEEPTKKTPEEILIASVNKSYDDYTSSRESRNDERDDVKELKKEFSKLNAEIKAIKKSKDLDKIEKQEKLAALGTKKGEVKNKLNVAKDELKAAQTEMETLKKSWAEEKKKLVKLRKEEKLAEKKAKQEAKKKAKQAKKEAKQAKKEAKQAEQKAKQEAKKKAKQAKKEAKLAEQKAKQEAKKKAKQAKQEAKKKKLATEQSADDNGDDK